MSARTRREPGWSGCSARSNPTRSPARLLRLGDLDRDLDLAARRREFKPARAVVLAQHAGRLLSGDLVGGARPAVRSHRRDIIAIGLHEIAGAGILEGAGLEKPARFLDAGRQL